MANAETEDDEQSQNKKNQGRLGGRIYKHKMGLQQQSSMVRNNNFFKESVSPHEMKVRTTYQMV